jgi:hypothetical protein
MPKQYKKKTRTKKAKAKAKAKANAGHVSAQARELLAAIEATLIQNHAQLAQSIARIAPILVLKSTQYKAFINSVTTSYEYRRKNIPSILLTMLVQSGTVLQRVNHLLRFHNEPGFLQDELRRRGLNAISAFIELTLTSMEELEETMNDYTQSALADYRGAQLGIETQPNMRNRTTRYTDAIVRPARTTRAQALTRRIRSI